MPSASHPPTPSPKYNGVVALQIWIHPQAEWGDPDTPAALSEASHRHVGGEPRPCNQTVVPHMVPGSLTDLGLAEVLLAAIWPPAVHRLQDFVLQLKEAVLFKHVGVAEPSVIRFNLTTGHNAGGRLACFPCHLYSWTLSHWPLKSQGG